jgi:hypothetical protein
MPDLIKVMISSRCDDPIQLHGQKKKYTDLREEIREAVEKEQLFGKTLFEVWLNEGKPPAPGDRSATEECLKRIDEADILIVLYNGNAGWAVADEDIGICHAELARAWNTEPSKMRIIKLPDFEPEESATGRNKRFIEYVKSLNRFRGEAKNGEQAEELVLRTLHEAVIEMVKREAMEGRYHLGPALVWSLLDFSGRKEVMENAIRDYLVERIGSKRLPPVLASLDEEKTKCGLFINVRDKKVLSLFHAIPDAMSIAAAREMVGRPFYRDYEYAVALKNDVIGPIHFIGCHRNVTETQVRNLVGHPDIILITAPFGVYMLDMVQHTQIVFIAGCRDETCTRNALGSFFEWLTLADKSSMLVAHANSRKNIVSAIKEEYKRKDAPSVQKVASP